MDSNEAQLYYLQLMILLPWLRDAVELAEKGRWDDLDAAINQMSDRGIDLFIEILGKRSLFTSLR